MHVDAFALIKYCVLSSDSTGKNSGRNKGYDPGQK